MKNSSLKRRKDKQKGSISLLGALSIVLSISSLVIVMELGQKVIEDRNFDSFAESVAPLALRSELAITQSMVDAGQGGRTLEVVHGTLAQLGYSAGDLEIKIEFGNIKTLDAPKTWTDPNTGTPYQITEEFEALSANAATPKASTPANGTPPDFSAVAIEIKDKNGLFGFYPTGRAIYGISESQMNSPDVASCYCDTRYNQCLVKPKTNSAMGNVDSKERTRYCETGLAPSVSGGMMGMFFGGDAEYYKADTVKFSPQWVGKPYQGVNVATDQTSTPWKAIEKDEPLTINNATQPFPEAYWKADDATWQEGSMPMQFTGYKKVSSFFGAISQYKNPWKLDNDTFYVGRSGVCAYPSDGFFFFGILSQISTFMNGNTDCIRYSANPTLKYEFAKPIESFMNAINGSTGANEHYYSCRDFTGLQSSRSGFFQVMRRIWTSPLQDWTRSYQDSECVVKKMHWHGWWIFGSWR